MKLKTVEVTKKELDLKDWVQRSAQERDCATLIDFPCRVVSEGKTIIIYDHPDIFTEDVEQALVEIDYHKTERSRGLKTRSRIFGFMPRINFRNPFCSAASLAREQPTQHSTICELGTRLSTVYLSGAPEMFKKHLGITSEKIKPEYQIEDTPFTSGIINKNNPLKYHYDAGNFKEVYSCMMVFKKNVDGGFLSCPEYDIAFKLPNKAVFLFDGQGILHGVTPIHYKSANSYRYSIVYYSMQQIWKCLTITDELARVRRVKAERERRRTSKNIEKTRQEFKK